MRTILLSVALLVFSSLAFAQDTTQGFRFSLGTSSAGIGIGDLRNYSGLRLNIDDQLLESINGINLSFVSQDRIGALVKRSNGIAIAIINNNFTYANGITLSVLSELSANTNGISAGLFGSGGISRNGISLGGIILTAHRINGFAGSIVCTSADTINGISISIISNAPFSGLRPLAYANGIIVSGLMQRLGKLNGIGIAPYNRTTKMNGIQIGIFNTSEELNGIQIGLLNNAANSIIPWFPGLNIGW